MYLFFMNKKDLRRREGFMKEMYTPVFKLYEKIQIDTSKIDRVYRHEKSLPQKLPFVLTKKDVVYILIDMLPK